MFAPETVAAFEKTVTVGAAFSLSFDFIDKVIISLTFAKLVSLPLEVILAKDINGVVLSKMTEEPSVVAFILAVLPAKSSILRVKATLPSVVVLVVVRVDSNIVLFAASPEVKATEAALRAIVPVGGFDEDKFSLEVKETLITSPTLAYSSLAVPTEAMLTKFN